MGGTLREQMGARRLSSRLVASLDTARALAALYVVCHHLVMTSAASGAWTYAFRFGQEAVIVFFLLSGFLIFHTERGRISDIRGYYLRRLRRIYPPLLCAMVIAAVIAELNGTLVRDFDVWALLGNLAALQDVSALKPGVVVDGFLGNSPLWSLSYEMFFYLAFPFVIALYSWARRGRTIVIIATVSVIAYGTYLVVPNHLSLVCAYFLVWWGGAYLADIWADFSLSIRSAFPMIAALCALSFAAVLGVLLYGPKDPGVFPVLPLRHFTFAAACVALCASPMGRWMAGLGSYGGRLGSFVASISYGLYVFHYPIIIEWRIARTPTGLLVAFLVLFAVAYLCDRLLSRVLPKPRWGREERGPIQRGSAAVGVSLSGQTDIHGG